MFPGMISRKLHVFLSCSKVEIYGFFADWVEPPNVRGGA